MALPSSPPFGPPPAKETGMKLTIHFASELPALLLLGGGSEVAVCFEFIPFGRLCPAGVFRKLLGGCFFSGFVFFLLFLPVSSALQKTLYAAIPCSARQLADSYLN